MIKVIIRTVAILTVACGVAFLFYLAVNQGLVRASALTPFANSLERDRPRLERRNFNGDNPSFFRPELGRDFDREQFRGEFSPTAGLLGLLRNLGIIAIITLFVVITQRLISLIARKRPRYT